MILKELKAEALVDLILPESPETTLIVIAIVPAHSRNLRHDQYLILKYGILQVETLIDGDTIDIKYCSTECKRFDDGQINLKYRHWK